MPQLDSQFDPILDEDPQSQRPSMLLGWSVTCFALGMSTLLAVFLRLLPLHRLDPMTVLVAVFVVFVVGLIAAGLAWRQGRKRHIARSLIVAHSVFVVLLGFALVFIY